MGNKKSIIKDKTFSFSLHVIELYKLLVSEKEYVLSKQLLRSATSVGANVEEASAAQSEKDFLHKMAIASKEARETKYWLRLLQESKFIAQDYTTFLSEIDVIINILTSIVKTMKEKIYNKSTQNS